MSQEVGGRQKECRLRKMRNSFKKQGVDYGVNAGRDFNHSDLDVPSYRAGAHKWEFQLPCCFFFNFIYVNSKE